MTTLGHRGHEIGTLTAFKMAEFIVRLHETVASYIEIVWNLSWDFMKLLPLTFQMQDIKI